MGYGQYSAYGGRDAPRPINGDGTPCRRVTNGGMSACAERLKPFTNGRSSCYGVWRGGTPENDRYAVYSYGSHWPIVVYLPQVDEWLTHDERYGPTTSNHTRELRDIRSKARRVSKDDLIEIARWGLVRTIQHKFNRSIAA